MKNAVLELSYRVLFFFKLKQILVNNLVDKFKYLKLSLKNQGKIARFIEYYKFPMFL
jgi:hypothetical protein